MDKVKPNIKTQTEAALVTWSIDFPDQIVHGHLNKVKESSESIDCSMGERETKNEKIFEEKKIRVIYSPYHGRTAEQQTREEEEKNWTEHGMSE